VKVTYTPKVAADLEEIADYLAPLSRRRLLSVREAIFRTVRSLEMFPLLGRRSAQDGVRRIGVPRHPYSLFYMIDAAAEEVVVLTVRHDARRSPV
jgi:plasmid stabilization system protein ParE